MTKLVLPEHIAVWNQCFGPYCDATYDCDGRWIEKAEHGKDTPYGWEIDHVWATALGGPDVLSNKRPRHRTGNRQAGGLLGALLAKAPVNTLHSPSYHTPIANALATMPPSPPRGLAAVASALASMQPPPPHSALGLANALARRSRTAEEPTVNALYSKPRGLF